MALSLAGWAVGQHFFWYGKSLRISQIDDEINYDNFGQAHVVVLADDGLTYWLRAY